MARAECPFCSTTVQQSAFRADDRFLAIYNISPVLPGHSLILPRAHVQSLLDLADADLAAFVLFARRITRIVSRAFAGDGFDWTVQDGRSAGQSVPHLHLHIIPRHSGDLPRAGGLVSGVDGWRARAHRQRQPLAPDARRTRQRHPAPARPGAARRLTRSAAIATRVRPPRSAGRRPLYWLSRRAAFLPKLSLVSERSGRHSRDLLCHL